jgi:hypothetical protein
MLLEVAKRSEDYQLCLAAIRMLENQTYLISLAIAGGAQVGWKRSMNTLDDFRRGGDFREMVATAALDRITDRSA